MASLPPLITSPSDAVPARALAYGALGSEAAFVDAAHPLPVTATLTPASSTPLAGSTSASIVAGPFAPVAGRPVIVSLSGSWSGGVRLQRSIDGGTTLHPLTVGGESWGHYGGNVTEIAWQEAEAGATLHLAITILSGTLSYRVSQ